MSTIEDLDVEQQLETHRSGLAVTSLVCSLIVCCPITTILGPILAVVSLLKMKGKPHITGKGFAISSIFVGVISTLVWVAGSMYLGSLVTDLINDFGRVSTATMKAGYEGDYDTFRSHLSRKTSKATDHEIKSFIADVEGRFGPFDKAFINMQDQDQQIQSNSQQEIPLPMRFIFETKDATGHITFEFIPSDTELYEIQITCIKIEDSIHGDIIFPGDSSCYTAVAADPEKTEDDSD